MSRRLRGPRTTLAASPRRRSPPAPACSPYPPTPATPPRPPSVFHPQLVKVDTPTRADKDAPAAARPGPDRARRPRLRRGGAAHPGRAGRPGRQAASTYDVLIPDLVARGVEIAELNEAYAASVARSAAAVGPHRLPHARTTTTPTWPRWPEAPAALVKKFALKRPSLDGRTIYGVEIGQGVRRANDGAPTFVLMGAPPRPRVALGRAGHGVRGRPGQELRQEHADHPPAEAGPRHRRAGRQRRRLRPLPHRRRVLRPARAQRVRPDRRHRLRRRDPGPAPTCARTAGSSTARTPPTAPAPPSSPAPAASAPAST